MNKILHFLFLMVCCNLSLRAGHAHVWSRQGKNPIQQAVKHAHAGDTLYIHAGGIYQEGNITLSFPITLIGLGYPVLDGENKCELISVKSEHVNISGLKLINSGYSDLEDMAAVRVYGKQFCRITHNILENNFFGIYLTNSFHCLIMDNRITGPDRDQNNLGNGIHCWKSQHNRIIGNTIKKHRDGIYFEFVKHSLIARNHSEENQRYGLHFMFSDSDTYYRNTFLNNGSGVAVMYSQQVIMLHNTFIRNWGSAAYGLLLKDIRDSRVIHNTFEKNTTGIFMDGCSRTFFNLNTYRNNGYALRMQANCDENLFRFNNFFTNTFDYATNGFTVLNTLEYNYWDKYQGFDMERNGVGDQLFRPMNMLTGVIEEYPASIILLQSFLSDLLNMLEKILPSLTPENLADQTPLIQPVL